MKRHIWLGLLWGVLLYTVTMILFPLMGREKLSLYKLLMGIPLWIVTGLCIGYLFNRNKKIKGTF